MRRRRSVTGVKRKVPLGTMARRYRLGNVGLRCANVKLTGRRREPNSAAVGRSVLSVGLVHPVIHNSFDIASCSRKCLFLREAKVKLTKIMQNGKSLFCMRISHAKRLVYNGMGLESLKV